jgi:hypothetical protein
MQISKEEFERIKNAQNEAFVRIDKNKDSIILITQKHAEIIEQVKDNKIEDLMSNEELNKKIKSIAGSSGRKTVFKWLAGILPAIEIVRQILERI